jgi:hypothetical protein
MGLNEILISFFFSSRFSNRNPFLFLAILCLGMASDAPTLNHTLDVQWEEWKTKHNKIYSKVGDIKSVPGKQRETP